MLSMILAAGLAHAQGFQSTDLDCANFKLMDANGPGDVNAMLHVFEFSGSCRLVLKGEDYVKPVHTFPVEAKVRWNVGEKQLDETVHIIGAFKWSGKLIGGVMTSSFKCNDDPLVVSAACNGFSHENKTALEVMSWPYKKYNRPFTSNLATPAQVLALAAKHPKKQPFKQAEAPPPKKKPPGLKSTDDAGIAPHVTIRSPKPGQVLSSGVVHLDVAGPETLIHKYAVGAVTLEWQWAETAGRLPSRPLWKTKSMMQSLKWSGHEGPIYFAAADLPFSRFVESSKWRVRARTANPAVPATGWVEFSVIPLGTTP